MRAFRIVPEEVFEETNIEPIRVKQFWFMVVDVLFLYGPVEPLGMGVHFRGLGIGVPVSQMELPEVLVKVFHKLAAVVGQHVLETEGKQKGCKVKKLLGRKRGMTPRGPGQREP